MLRDLFIVLSTLLCLTTGSVIVNSKIETVAYRSSAVFSIQLTGEQNTTTTTAHNVSCSVTFSGVTRPLGNWTTGTRTPIMKLAPDINEIFNHRLTVSFQANVISISVTNTTFSDSGIYTCQWEGKHQSEINLNVVGGPLIMSRNVPASVTMAEGTTRNFEFVLCGNPKPNVTWTLSGNTEKVEGVPVKRTFGLRSEQTTEKYSLETHCYSYQYVTPAILQKTCNLNASYTIQGDASQPIKDRVSFLVSFKPEPVTDIMSLKDDNNCIQTKWSGPILDPGHCHSVIDYHVEVLRTSLPPVIFKTYSNNFRICENHVGVVIGDVTDIRVRYVNRFGQGDYVSTRFVSDFSLPGSAVPDVTESETNFKNIAITTGGLLGLFVLVVLVFIVYYAVVNCSGCCRTYGVSNNVEEGVRANKKTSSSSSPDSSKAQESQIMKTPRKSRIRKDTIVPKPQKLAQVTSHALHKSHTFSAYDTLNNHFAPDETLQKGYMPLNTLQRRITESLAAAKTPLPKVSTVPIFDDIFENNNVEMDDDERKRASGASAETECTSLGSRTTLDNGHLGLGRTYSLESSVSDFDMPYTIDLDKIRRKSIYDLPRSQTFHGGARPSSIIRNPDADESNMYDKQEPQARSEYALPNITVNQQLKPDSTRDARFSVYSSPRKSVVDDLTDNVAAADNKAYNDDKVIYDKPRIPDKNSDSDSEFAPPVISQITGLYDTPRIQPKQDDSFEEQVSSDHYIAMDNVDNESATSPPDTEQDTVDSSPAIGGSSENLYDNINFILTKYGCTTNENSSTGVYDELPGTGSNGSSSEQSDERPYRKTEC